jgi:hypothetical protein
MQSGWYQPLKESGELHIRIFGNTILTSHEHVSLGIHQSNKATRPIKESPVKNKVLTLPQVQLRRWRQLFQMVVNHIIKLPRTMSALAYQLSDRITFNNPAPKPFLFLGMPGSLIAPAIGLSTRDAKPTLFSISVMTVSPKNT